MCFSSGNRQLYLPSPLGHDVFYGGPQKVKAPGYYSQVEISKILWLYLTISILTHEMKMTQECRAHFSAKFSLHWLNLETSTNYVTIIWEDGLKRDARDCVATIVWRHLRTTPYRGFPALSVKLRNRAAASKSIFPSVIVILCSLLKQVWRQTVFSPPTRLVNVLLSK